jgi:hypothetical protein
MTSTMYYGLIGAAVLTLCGCRQPDGAVPTPDATVQEELGDVSRDLQYIAAARDPEAPKNLADDLRKYAQRSSAAPAVDELSRRTAGAIAGSQMTEQAAQRLTHNLWLSVAARDISERQIESLQNDTQSLLVSVGVAEDRAQQVALQVGEVQRAVTTRPRRWYEFF